MVKVGDRVRNIRVEVYITEEEIFHTIKNEDIFKKSYKSFLREHKLNKLLNE
jgi:hypothetical protein